MAIPRFKKENIGSLSLIEYTPFYAVLLFVPGKVAINKDNLILREGYEWQSVYCSQDTMGYQQDQNNTDHGESFTQQVVGFIPGDEPDIETGLLDLGRKRFLLRITLNNGQQKIVGTPAETLLFKTKSNTTELVSGRTGTLLTFYGETLSRGLFLTS